MTPYDLRERVARAIYERCKKDFAEDPATVSIGDDFADDVFPPWDETNQEPYFADAAIAEMRPAIRDEALEEAAKVAEGPVKRRSLVTGEVIYRGTDEHDYAVDGSSDYGAGRIEAAAEIRALKSKP